MKDAITYANEAGFFEFNVVGWKAEFERLIEAVRADALAELATVNDSLTVQDHIRDATKMVKRPQNCGTGFCSCIECVVKPGHIAPVRKMVPDHIADAGNKVSDHIAASGKVILTEEQAQQIEEALAFAASHSEYLADDLILYGEALATIRAARAQEQAEQEPVAWPIDCDIAKRIADKQCVSYEVVQLIAREILPAKHGPVLWGDDKFAPHERPRKHPVRTKDLTDDEISDAIHGKGSPLRLHDYAIRDFRAAIAADREKNK